MKKNKPKPATAEKQQHNIKRKKADKDSLIMREPKRIRSEVPAIALKTIQNESGSVPKESKQEPTSSSLLDSGELIECFLNYPFIEQDKKFPLNFEENTKSTR